MSHFDYELQMDNEFDTKTDAPVTTEPIGGNGTYYKELVKQKKPSGFKRFIAGILILAIVAAPIFGVTAGLGMKIADKYFVEKEAAELAAESVFEPSIPADFPAISVAYPANSIVELVKQARLSVVNITTSIANNDYFYRYYFYGRNEETPGSGTGIVFKEDEENVYIVTNYHVIENANKAYVSFTEREQIPAKLVGSNKVEDIAVISVKKADMKTEGINEVTVAKFGDSSAIEVGEWVVAIGNALGNGKTVTYGIISAINKEMDFSDGKKALNFIQTDAAINPGNSGGALVDMNGNVIGVNTAKIADYRVDGMGFAIPINSVKTVVDGIMQNKASVSGQPFIGISGTSVVPKIEEYYSLIVSKGIIVDEVFEDGGAADAGIRPGDIIIEMDGQKLDTIEQLQTIIASKQIGESVNAKVIRNNEREIDVIIKIKDRADIYLSE